jgi:adenylate kinase
MAAFLVLLGPPGVGKGTQAKILADTTQFAHISSGDLFRENIKNQTELGKIAKAFIDKGELAPDDLTINMMRARLQREDCKLGAILDGFPRNPAQADALAKMLTEFTEQVKVVVYITAAEETIVERVSGRWNCRAKGHIYHQTLNPPKQKGVCDVDGSELYQRDDDKVETARKRVHVYLEQTAPLVEYYRKRGKLIEINGVQDVEQVTKDLLAALKK